MLLTGSFSQYEECQSELHPNGDEGHCKVPPMLTESFCPLLFSHSFHCNVFRTLECIF